MKIAKNFPKSILLLLTAVFSLTASAAFADVAIKSSNFPDSIFREYVKNFDTDSDGTLSDSELAAVTEIDVSSKGITNLNGIKYFTALEVLSCDNNSLSNLDLSKNTALVTLDCSYNNISTLDLSNLTHLSKLKCHASGSSTVDVSNTAITSLNFEPKENSDRIDLGVGGLVAKNCANLETVRFTNATYLWLKTLDLSGCSSLKEIHIDHNSNPNYSYREIHNVILKDCTSLTDLSGSFSSLANSNLQSIDLSGCTSLISLDCSSSGTKYLLSQILNIDDCINLKYLKCSGNILTMLDLSSNTALTEVNCYNQSRSNEYRTKQTLYLTGNDDYLYQYDFTALIPAEYISRIDADSIVTYDSNNNVIDDNVKYENGILMLKNFANYVEYDFNTGYSDEVIRARFVCKSSSGGTPTVPTITTASLSYGIVGLSYGATLDASGTTPITWSVTSGTLPDGITLNGSTGKFSGTPTTAGTFSFTVQAKNIGGTATKNLSIVIGDTGGGGDDDDDDDGDDDDNEDGTSKVSKVYSKPKITTETLFEGTVGLEYGYILKAEGTMPIIWGLASGDDFPAGLTLTQVGQITQITGTPTMSGDFTFTVQAQNSVGLVSKDLTIKINPAPEKTKPTILTSELEPCIVGINYGLQLMASGTPPIKWTITKPKKLPKDLEFSSNGSFSGIIRKAQKVKITVKAENEYGSFSKIFTLQSYVAPNIDLTSLKDAKVWKKYTGTFKTKPTATKPLTWVLTGGLPDGFMFNASKGKITGTGTPDTYGAYPLIIKVSNPASTDIKSFTFNVSADLPKIKLSSLSKGTDGKKYKAVIKAAGTTPISFDIEGNLPDGLSFDSSTGTLEGTPDGICNNRKIKITASNVAGKTSKTFYLTINGVVPKFTTKSLPVGLTDSLYSVSIDVSGTKPVKITQTGLPKGLELNADENSITGTPTESGTFSVTLTASNSVKTVTKKYKLTVNAPPSFNDASTLAAATADKKYKKFKFSMGGTKGIIFQLDSGSLPDGMSLNASNGTLSGKPKTAGIFTFTVKATNAYGSSSKEFSLTVNAVQPKISGSLKSGKVGEAYSSTLKVKGTAPINWVADSVPSWLELSDGVLSGTPTEPFDGYVTITASNASLPGGGRDSKIFRLKITGTAISSDKTVPEETLEALTENQKDVQKLFIGNPRNISDVKNLKILENYKIAAVLPEIFVTESGLYDFEAEISADIETGTELIWLACSEKPSEDDEIAEFYDSEGKEISNVPENHKITVGAWFNENIIYAPVIAVKKQ